MYFCLHCLYMTIFVSEVEIPEREVAGETEQNSEENSELEERLYNGFQGPFNENEQNILPLNVSSTCTLSKFHRLYPALLILLQLY